MTFYRNILRQALRISWRNKYLWFFGLFAALLGSGGELDLLFRSFSANPEEGIFSGIRSFAETGIFNWTTFSNLKNLMNSQPFTISIMVIILVFILLLFIFLIWLAVVSQSALVHNSANIIADKKVEFKDGLVAGIQKFWPVLWLNVFSRTIVYIVIITVSSTLILIPLGKIASNFFYFVSFIILVPATLVFILIVKFAITFVVIKGADLRSAVVSSWKLFKDNWIVSVEMAFILFFINILFGLVVVMALAVLAIPFLFLGILFQMYAPFIGLWTMASLGLLILTIIIISAGSIMTVFQTTSWTNLFIELIGKGGTSKIVRMVSNWTEKK